MANNITDKSRVRVYWDAPSEDYSVEGKNRIVAHFAKEYGLERHKVKVVFRASKAGTDGELIQIEDANVDNIMDKTYQRSLFKEWLERNEKEVDFDRLIGLDDKVNAALDVDFGETRHRAWKINKLLINNFLCFGEGNEADFSKLIGFNIVSSTPANQGGKSTFIVDAIKFLLFGKTTKTEKNEEIFNTFSDKDTVTLKGYLTIDGDNFVLERKLTRKEKKAGGYSVSSKLNYYEILPDGEEKVLEEEHSKETTKKIVDTIGSEKDFETVIMATGRNLEDLIDSKPTERGKLLTRFIGLEVIEEKESIVRGMWSQYQKSMKSNIYNKIDLNDEIVTHELNITASDKMMIQLAEEMKTIESEITRLDGEKTRLLASKKHVDQEIMALNPSKLAQDLEKLKTDGEAKVNEEKALKDKIATFGDLEYDEDLYLAKVKEINLAENDVQNDKTESSRLLKLVQELTNGSICPTCKRSLEDVDHSAEIKQHQQTIKEIDGRVATKNEALAELRKELSTLNGFREKMKEKNATELTLSKVSVDVISLRTKYKEMTADLKGYNANIDAIEFNRQVDLDVTSVSTKLQVQNRSKEVNISENQKAENEKLNNQKAIEEKKALIDTIDKEKEVEKIFKLYIEMVGKKGISKLVLRSVLPIINSELHNLLDGVCDFDVELELNSKNEVAFTLIKNDIKKQLKSGSGFERTASALALRCVLGKISTLPKPNFIAFDEVLGKVSDQNLDNIKLLFDRVKDMYESVFLITHNHIVNDWGDNIVTVVKTEDISTLNVKN